MLFRDIRYIIKRIIVGVGIALVLSFLRGNLLLGVSALSFPSPSSVQVTNNNNTQTIYNGNPSSVSWYSATGYSGANSPYQLQWNQGRFNFWYNGTLCQNKVVTAQVTTLMYSEESYIDFSNSLFRLKVYNGESETACALNTLQQNSKVATWTCIFTNYSNSAFFINNLTFVNNTFGIAIGNDSNYSCSPTTNDMIQSNQDQTNQIINSQNNNTTSIIQNNNSNTQTIINNQNENTEKEIESQKACTLYDKNYVVEQGGFLISNGSKREESCPTCTWGISDYISINNSNQLYIYNKVSNSPSLCFYDSTKSLISCSAYSSLTNGNLITIPNNASFVRFSIQQGTDRPQFKICKNGNQAIVDSQQDINNTLNNSNVDSATSQASDFFNNFNANSHGLSGIITSPLRLIQSLSSSTCSSLIIPLPFVNQSATIPCMSSIYSLYPSFYNLWQLITTGLICYWIVIKIFGHVKGMQNPNDDRIEVVDL